MSILRQIFLGNKTRKIRLTRHVARMGENRYGFMVGIPEGKILTGRLRRRWEDNIQRILK